MFDTTPSAKGRRFTTLGVFLWISQQPSFVVIDLVFQIDDRAPDLGWGGFDLLNTFLQSVERRYRGGSIEDLAGKSAGSLLREVMGKRAARRANWS